MLSFVKVLLILTTPPPPSHPIQRTKHINIQ